MVFVAFLVLLLAQSLAPRHIETFALGDSVPLPPMTGRTDTVTLDVRDGDQWRYIDFDRGLLLVPPDSAGWDLAARRFQLRVPPAEAVVSPSALPETDAEATLPRWYHYDFLAHLLRPSGEQYRLHTDQGRDVDAEVLGYYCPGPTAGCLTLRYTPRPGHREHDPE